MRPVNTIGLDKMTADGVRQLCKVAEGVLQILELRPQGLGSAVAIKGCGPNPN